MKEREREKERKRTLRRASRRGGWREKKKRSSKLTAASGRLGATGSPLRPKTLPVLLDLAGSPLRSPLVLSRSRLSFSFFLSRTGPALLRPTTVPPAPQSSLAPLEARQMSGIRLRHLSVSPSVTFDSRQIERRARESVEKRVESGREKTRDDFLLRGPVTRERRR